MGHPNPYYNDNLMDESCPDSLGDEFVLTYTSQEFPMVQEDLLQSFKLPEPVLCIGGILQAELRGDGLLTLFNFNGWMPSFEVVGRPLSPAFGVEILGPSGNFVLKALSYTQRRGNVVDPVEYEWEDGDGDEESYEELLYSLL